MKFLLWSVTGLIALLGTLAVALMAGAAGWLADNAAVPAAWAGQMAQWPVPPWLALWVDPVMLEWLRSALPIALEWLAATLPGAGPLLQWVAPVLWISWAVLLLCLLTVAGVAHVAIGQAAEAANGVSGVSIHGRPPIAH